MYIDIHKHENGKLVAITDSDILGECVGIHPFDVCNGYDPEQLSRLVAEPAVIALGEVGLDYRSQYKSSAQIQCEIFESQIEIANHADKPIVVHQVRALDDTLRLLTATNVAVVFHGFSGSIESAARILKAGYYLSFGHLLLHSDKLAQVLRHTPLDRVFFETDESDVSIEAIYTEAARILGITILDLEKQIEKNYNDVFMARAERTAAR